MAIAMLKSACVDRREKNTMPGGIDDVRPPGYGMYTSHDRQNAFKPRDSSQLDERLVVNFDWLL